MNTTAQNQKVSTTLRVLGFQLYSNALAPFTDPDTRALLVTPIRRP